MPDSLLKLLLNHLQDALILCNCKLQSRFPYFCPLAALFLGATEGEVALGVAGAVVKVL